MAQAPEQRAVHIPLALQLSERGFPCLALGWLHCNPLRLPDEAQMAPANEPRLTWPDRA